MNIREYRPSGETLRNFLRSNAFVKGIMVPLEYGRITYDSPIRFVLKTDEIEAEFYFLALEKDEDVKKVLSMELTAVFVDEAREIPKSLIDALSGRVGRYPSA